MTQNRRLVAVRMSLSVYAGIVAVPNWGQVAKKAPVPKTAMEIEEITVVAQKREEVWATSYLRRGAHVQSESVVI